VENLTHSLFGVALAELALAPSATRLERRLFMAAGLVAANLPDADLLYVRITPPPLGYMLHHRGHTHTVLGLVAQAALVALVCALPAMRRTIASAPHRFWLLVSLALFSHLALDSWNSYGVHPFYPIDNAWYYGDAISIFEPWLWVFLGFAASLNAVNRAVGQGVAILVLGLLVALASFRMIPLAALLSLIGTGVLLAVCTRRQSPVSRSSVALAATTLFVALMFGLSRMALTTARGTLSNVVDVVLTPQPANPLAWNAIGIEVSERSAEYVLRRGVVSFPANSVQWREERRQSLTSLRAMARDDCWVRAWLQFGRVPVLNGPMIADYRFGPAQPGNFTMMELRSRYETSTCPPNLTDWKMPRADLVRSPGIEYEGSR
jgi:inner membrane protein